MSSDIAAAADKKNIPAGVEVAECAAGRVARQDHRGMVSAEWTVGIIAAIAIAGVLLAVVTSGQVEDLLLKVVLAIIKTFTKGL
jgi:hypothetical protein